MIPQTQTTKENGSLTRDDIIKEVEATKETKIVPIAAGPGENKPHYTVEDLKAKFHVDLSLQLQPQPVCLEIKGRKGSAPIGTYGGITLVTAKAKSGKTFATSLFVAALIKAEELQEKIIPSYLPGKSIVQVFDTEQSAYHVQRVGKRIEYLAEKVKPVNLQVYKLRTESNSDKEKIIEQIIYGTPELAAIVIDGGKDLIFDINNPEESTKAVSKLLKWAEELNILIIVILHQNKGDNNARGHYGTELKNKAEVVVNVTKDEEQFIVESEACRDREFEPFAFKIDQQGMPYIVSEWLPAHTSTEGKRQKPKPHEIDETFHRERIKEAYSKEPLTSYSNTWRNIKNAFLPFTKIGDNDAKELLTYYKSKGWVISMEPAECGKSWVHYKMGLSG